MHECRPVAVIVEVLDSSCAGKEGRLCSGAENQRNLQLLDFGYNARSIPVRMAERGGGGEQGCALHSRSRRTAHCAPLQEGRRAQAFAPMSADILELFSRWLARHGVKL